MKWGLAISEGILMGFTIIYLTIFRMNHEGIPLILLIYTLSLAIYLFHIREDLSDLETLSPTVLAMIYGYYALDENPYFLLTLILIILWLYSSQKRMEEVIEYFMEMNMEEEHEGHETGIQI